MDRALDFSAERKIVWQMLLQMLFHRSMCHHFVAEIWMYIQLAKGAAGIIRATLCCETNRMISTQFSCKNPKPLYWAPILLISNITCHAVESVPADYIS
jgi:hypothetical protein